MDNKERNQQILEITCEFLEQLNTKVNDAFAEDIEVQEGEEEVEQVLVGVTVENPGNLIGFKGFFQAEDGIRVSDIRTYPVPAPASTGSI